MCPKFAVRDTWLGRYLESATMPTGDARITVTTWTHSPERAFPFQSIKAARRMAAALGEGERFQAVKLRERPPKATERGFE